MKTKLSARPYWGGAPLLLAAALSAAAAWALASDSASYRLEPAALSAAGGERASTNYQLWAVVGEPAVGPAAATNYDLFGGIDLSAADTTPTPVSARELRDHLLGRATLSAQRLPIADINADGQIDVADLIAAIKRDGG